MRPYWILLFTTLILLLPLLHPLFAVYGQSLSNISTVYIDPLASPGSPFLKSGPAPMNFTINVRLSLVGGEVMNTFDVLLNYSSPATVVTAVQVNYTGNVFASGNGSVLLECINGVVVTGNCPIEAPGQVHFTEIDLGKNVTGPLDASLFSVKFSVKGNGTSLFTVPHALLANPGTGKYPSPHFIQYVAEAGVFGNFGEVPFFNFIPSAPPSVLVAQPVMFDGKGSFDANNTSISIVSYTWDFGDGTRGAGSPVYHVFNSPGNYSVSLTVKDQNGGTGPPLVRIVSVVPALGALNLFLRDQNGLPVRGSAATVKIFNSTLSPRPFAQTSPDTAGSLTFSSLAPGSYFVRVFGSNILNQSKTESVVAGWTAQDTVYLTIVNPPPPPPDYGPLIYLGSILGGVGVVAAILVAKRLRLQHSREVEKKTPRSRRARTQNRPR